MDGRKARGVFAARLSRSFQSSRLSRRLLAEAYERVVPVIHRVIRSTSTEVETRRRREVAS